MNVNPVIAGFISFWVIFICAVVTLFSLALFLVLVFSVPGIYVLVC